MASQVDRPESVIQLEAGHAVLRAAPALGGRITALRLVPEGASDSVDVLLPFPEETKPDALLHWPRGGIYPLLPYGNRIRNARLVFRGRVHDLPARPDAARHTLHGPAHRAPWHVSQCE